jgi:hypothetical protein
MSRDNTTNFDSWNTHGYNKDTRHAPDGKEGWDDQYGDLNQEFITNQTLSHIQRMLESRDPKVRQLAHDLVNQKGGSAGALKSHNQQLEESLKTQVAKPRGRRRSWDSSAINDDVRSLWSRLNGDK